MKTYRMYPKLCIALMFITFAVQIYGKPTMYTKNDDDKLEPSKLNSTAIVDFVA